MKRKHFLLVTFAILLALDASAAKYDLDITLSTGISRAHRKAIAKDLAVLENLNFKTAADSETLKVLGIDKLNSLVLSNWLEDRVKYIIEDTSSKLIRKRIRIEERLYNFENPSARVTLEIAAAKLANSSASVTVMSNIGSLMYFSGKSEQILYSYPVRSGVLKKEYVKVSSPRSGLIMIGEGLFNRRYDFDRENVKAKVNSLKRLTTFFHEARHSDGSKSSLAFFHAICPTGHDFAGLSACDRNLNGPYAVGAQITKELLKNCITCTDDAKERMKLRYLDSLNRIIKITTKISEVDSKKIEKLEEDQSQIKFLLEIISQEDRVEALKEMKRLEKEILAISSNEGNMIQVASKYLDATPEGKRFE